MNSHTQKIPQPTYNQQQKDQLVEILTDFATLSHPSDIKHVVARLPDPLAARVEYDGSIQQYLFSLVEVCTSYPEGLKAMREAVYFFESNSYAMKRLDAFMMTLHAGPQADLTRNTGEHLRLVPPESATPDELNAQWHHQPIDELVDMLEHWLIQRRIAQNAAEHEKSHQVTEKIDLLAQAIRRRIHPREGAEFADSTLIKVIEAGTFASVWLATSRQTGELVATRIFHVDKLSQGTMVWQFRRGVRALQRLADHRLGSVMRIRAVDKSGLAFSMDYFRHGNLSDIAQRTWTLDKKVNIVIKMCEALTSVHRAGYVHRDIKPSNILIDENHNPVLTDFDLATMPLIPYAAQSSDAIGTPYFAAPEQLQPHTPVIAAADIYSLGRLLHFLLLEDVPALQTGNEPTLKDLRQFPASLTEIIRKATQNDAHKRYPSAHAMGQALRRFRTTSAVRRAHIRRTLRWKRKHLLLIAVTWTLVSLVAWVSLSQGVFAKRNQHLIQQLRDTQSTIEEQDDKLKILQQDTERWAIEATTLREHCELRAVTLPSEREVSRFSGASTANSVP